MASKLSNLETKLDEVFVRSAPKLPEGAKKAVVNWLPIISLIVGVFSLFSAWSLWHWAHLADSALGGLCNAYSVSGCSSLGTPSRFSIWLWLGIILIAVEGLVYLLAYPGLQARKKQGWNYLYYGALLNVVYAVISLFTGYNAASSFLGALIGSAIGFYVLFQIRSVYAGKQVAAAPNRKDSEKK